MVIKGVVNFTFLFFSHCVSYFLVRNEGCLFVQFHPAFFMLYLYFMLHTYLWALTIAKVLNIAFVLNSTTKYSFFLKLNEGIIQIKNHSRHPWICLNKCTNEKWNLAVFTAFSWATLRIIFQTTSWIITTFIVAFLKCWRKELIFYFIFYFWIFIF